MRRFVLVVGLATALALAGCMGGQKAKGGYPDNYVLDDGEVPPEAKLSEETGYPISNPGKVPNDLIDDVAKGAPVPKPDELWAEFFEPAGADQPGQMGGVVLLSAWYDDESEVQGLVTLARQNSEFVCGSPEEIRGLYDGHVVLLLMGDENAGELIMDAIFEAVKAKAPGLKDVCD